jgi:arabinan endo-1,5-alpha-L-arabinosidase
MFHRPVRLTRSRLPAWAVIIVATIWPCTGHDAAATPASLPTYTNPVMVTIPTGGVVESCADPSVVRGAGDDPHWYAFCTTDPLNSSDRNATGGFNFHLIPILRSADLVHWTYAGDVFSARPDWVADDAGLWAPDIRYMNGQFYLYYAASWTDLPGGGSAIGVATSAGPLGPWADSGAPVVEPHAPSCCPGDKRWVFDPAVVTDDSGQNWIYYGSYFGGVSVRQLSADGLQSDPNSQTQVTIANRYEGAFVTRHGEYYYLFVSATDCCRGPLTGYSVFVGRATTPAGPFVDRDGVSLLAGQVGGTPALSMNGNRWVGPGHNTVFTDVAGRDWVLYHAVDRTNPYFTGATGFTRRPLMMDMLVWKDGWPSVRNVLWASDTPQTPPAAVPGARAADTPKPFKMDVPNTLIDGLSDEFSAGTPGSQWSWVREPAAGTYRIQDGLFAFDTQSADLFEGSNNASVLVARAPTGSFLVEAKVHVNTPAEGCCFNFVQGGLVLYGGDDNFIKLAEVSIWETRQTEFAKELFPVPAGFPRYGNTVVTSPGEWTYLRIAARKVSGVMRYTAYTSRDGLMWNHGGTWTHDLGNGARIGLVSMGGSGFTTQFDYVRVYTLDRTVD